MTIAASPATAAHYLNRLGFGPRPGDIDRVCSIGLPRYIDEQLEASQPDPAVERLLERLPTIRYSPSEIVLLHQRDQQSRASIECILDDLRTAKLFRAASSVHQLAEVMTDFWYNHFNVYIYAWEPSVPQYERSVIRPHVFGSFRDLLRAVATSPAMTYYLDTYVNTANRMVSGKLVKGINENYGRELLELHTVGVTAGYTQHDVYEAARCFTGWDFGGWLAPVYEFRFLQENHDQNQKTVFGLNVPEGGADTDGFRLLDYLASHPKTAQFISMKLVQRFVADRPPESLVRSCSETFLKTDGSIRDVLRTMFTSDEFRSEQNIRAKVKTPFEFVTSAIRALGGTVQDGKPLAQAVAEMGMPLYECKPPTGYSNRSSDWVNVSSQLHKFNFAMSLATGTFRGVHIGAPQESRRAAEAFAAEILGNPLTKTTSRAVGKVTDLPKATALLLASPEFQVR